MSHTAVEARLAALQRHLSSGLSLPNGELNGWREACYNRNRHTFLTKMQHVVQQVWSCSRPRAQEPNGRHLEGAQEV